MEALLFFKSLLLGVAVAAPLGPIGALCINRTLERGFAAGISGGLGTALADGLYASFAAFGFAAFAGVLSYIDFPLRLFGGIFMLWLGWKSLGSSPMRDAAEVSAHDLLGTLASTFLLTLANPMTILSFAALFAGLGLASTSGLTAAGTVIFGVLTGSMLWWCILAGGVTMARHRLPVSFAVWISRVSAVVLLVFGVWAIASALVGGWPL